MTAGFGTVLIVEDEALLLFSIADDLRDQGFDVIEASNAAQALKELERNPKIGLLFTDIDMPRSMDGLALAAAVRDRWPPVRIVVTSGKIVRRRPNSLMAYFCPNHTRRKVCRRHSIAPNGQPGVE